LIPHEEESGRRPGGGVDFREFNPLAQSLRVIAANSAARAHAAASVARSGF